MSGLIEEFDHTQDTDQLDQQPIIDHRCALSDVQCIECNHVTTCPVVQHLTDTQINMWKQINKMWRHLTD